VRLSNPGLRALEPLLHEDEFALLTRLKREKRFLNPEEYYLIGFHFAERPFVDRIFGGDILRWIVKTFPGDANAAAAANKLIMEGFPPPPQPRRKTVQKKTAQKKTKAPQKAPQKAPKTKATGRTAKKTPVARSKPAAPQRGKKKPKSAAKKKTRR